MGGVLFHAIETYHTNQNSKWYSAVELPGAYSSMDIVHVKWLNCPTGNHNLMKGKEGYIMLGFQCIFNYSRRLTNDKQS